MYLVTKRFTDLEHGRKYEMGDEYPAKGYDATPERIAALASGNNKAGIKLIKEVKASKPKKVAEAKPKEDKPKAKPKKAKTGGKKKASK